MARVKGTLKTKRVYDTQSKDDGFRVFVERLWPRGISKEKAAIDLWLKEIAPSTELRKWFNHDPTKWNEFLKRYHLEIKDRPDLFQQILDPLKKGNVTLLYGSKEERFNAATALASFLQQSLKE
jgi:uncharacterized protein YeaO (DUF488 family)